VERVGHVRRPLLATRNLLANESAISALSKPKSVAGSIGASRPKRIAAERGGEKRAHPQQALELAAAPVNVSRLGFLLCDDPKDCGCRSGCRCGDSRRCTVHGRWCLSNLHVRMCSADADASEGEQPECQYQSLLVV
jgi:hypothetical protein